MPSTILKTGEERKDRDARTGGFARGRWATYWLIVERGLDRPGAPTVGILPDEEALAVFSFEDEALLVLSVQGLAENWTARQFVAADLVPYLLDSRPARVALDPLPGFLGGQMFGLPSMPKERFLRDLVLKRESSAKRPHPVRGCGE
jgi:hypothetical protein